VGINNLGSTCFMNSVIKSLNTISDFSDKICSLITKSSSFLITIALKEVFYNLRKPENHNPLEFFSTI
jgi:ubiquitin C-terminal hydrolase